MGVAFRAKREGWGRSLVRARMRGLGKRACRLRLERSCLGPSGSRFALRGTSYQLFARPSPAQLVAGSAVSTSVIRCGCKPRSHRSRPPSASCCMGRCAGRGRPSEAPGLRHTATDPVSAFRTRRHCGSPMRERRRSLPGRAEGVLGLGAATAGQPAVAASVAPGPPVAQRQRGRGNLTPQKL